MLDPFERAQGHVREKWWLRATKVIGSIGVKDLTIVFNTEAKVSNNTTGKIQAIAAKQAKNDEIAVPSI
jgi:hypothetical protein